MTTVALAVPVGIIVLPEIWRARAWRPFALAALAAAAIIALLPLQQVVYRQLTYLVVIESVLAAVRGLRLGWQHVVRSGQFDASPQIATAGDAAQPAERRASPSA